MGIQIIEIANPISYFHWIQECNFTEITPDLVLARCITGEYQCYGGMIDNNMVGIAIIKGYGTMAFIVGAWCKNQAKNFMSDFFSILKDNGFLTVRASANFDEKVYERLTGMNKLWTVYEGCL